jgi:hypothetical protein
MLRPRKKLAAPAAPLALILTMALCPLAAPSENEAGADGLEWMIHGSAIEGGFLGGSAEVRACWEGFHHGGLILIDAAFGAWCWHCCADSYRYGGQLIVEANGEGAEEAMRSLAIAIEPQPVEQRVHMLAASTAHVTFTWRQVHFMPLVSLGAMRRHWPFFVQIFQAPLPRVDRSAQSPLRSGPEGHTSAGAHFVHSSKRPLS